MVKAFLWIITAVLVGVIAWLLFVGGPSGEPIEREHDDAPEAIHSSTPSVSAPSARPAPSPKATDEEQLRLRRSILSGNYAAAPPPTERPEPSADVVILKNKKKLQGKIISESADAIMFQAEGEKQAQRIPLKDVLRTSTALKEAARSAARSGARGSDGPSGEGKSELRMTPEELKQHRIKKKLERMERNRNRGGIRAINMARDLKKDLEDKNR